MLPTSELVRRIEESLPGAQVEVIDLTGGEDHYQVKVVSSLFAGRSRLQRHRMIYAALREAMGGDVHALALTTQTPEEAQG